MLRIEHLHKLEISAAQEKLRRWYDSEPVEKRVHTQVMSVRASLVTYIKLFEISYISKKDSCLKEYSYSKQQVRGVGIVQTVNLNQSECLKL